MAALSEFDIRRLLSDSVDGRIARLQVLATIDSTNSYLISEPAPAPGYWSVVIAHEQTDGRGRGGNAWHSPPGGGLWLSAAHTFETPPANLAPLTLVLGVVVASELEALGVEDVGVKWPNDIVADGRKLGGILVETASPGATAVMGLGLNLRLADPADIGGDPALEPVDLASLVPEPPKRAPLAAARRAGSGPPSEHWLRGRGALDLRAWRPRSD